MAPPTQDHQPWTELYRLRRSRSWTPQQLAHQIGCSYGLICDIEAGRARVTAGFIDRACAVFGIANTWDLEQTVPLGQRGKRASRLKVAS